MTEKFTEQYLYKIDLCRRMLHYACYAEETGNLKPSEVRKALLLFFTEDVINHTTNRLLGLEN